MKIDELNPIELGRQLMKPSGEQGKLVGENMNIANSSIYSNAFKLIKFNDGERILEIGFGNGKFISNYFKINPNIIVFGVDFSDTMCKEAISLNQKYIDQNKLVLKCEDAACTSFDNESFNTIITINTIYFWNSIEKQIEEISRLLKRGGRLLIGFRPKSIMKNSSFTSEVFSLFESDDIIELFKKHNFKLIEENAVNISRKSVDGEDINSIDICLVFENCKN